MKYTCDRIWETMFVYIEFHCNALEININSLLHCKLLKGTQEIKAPTIRICSKFLFNWTTSLKMEICKKNDVYYLIQFQINFRQCSQKS